MALLTETRIAVDGTTVPFVAADVAGDSFVNTGYQRVRFKNISAGALTVTVDTPNPDNYGVVNNVLDITLTVPANGEISAGPFRIDRHNDAQGRVQMTYPGGVTNLTVAITN